jgi:hypothetical protein
MKKISARHFLILSLFVLAACGGGEDTLAKLNGNWSVDTIASMGIAENRPDNIFERALTEGILGMTSIQIDAINKRMTITRGLLSTTSSFTLASVKGNQVTIITDDEKKEFVFEINDNDTITLKDNSGGYEPMVMIRR